MKQNDYVNAILTQLAESYRRSRKDDGTNVINRRTALKPEKLYRAYRQNDGDPMEIEALNEAARRCAQAGFIHYEMPRYSNEIDTIYLVDAQIETIEAYLKEHYGITYDPDKYLVSYEIIGSNLMPDVKVYARKS